MAPKILIILHQETSSTGRIGQELIERGYHLDIRRPRFGDALPMTMQEHVAAVVFGGPMSANDHDAYIKREIDWINIPLKEQVPFLGICLGAQMLVRCLGGEVYQHKAGAVEIGYYPIQPTEEGRFLFDWPQKVYQWHREGFDVPMGSRLLAKGDIFPNQAIAVGPAAYGIQFHPELTLAMMHRWIVNGETIMNQPKAQPRGLHFEGRAIYDGPLHQWLVKFIDRWLGRVSQKEGPVLG